MRLHVCAGGLSPICATSFAAAFPCAAIASSDLVRDPSQMGLLGRKAAAKAKSQAKERAGAKRGLSQGVVAAREKPPASSSVEQKRKKARHGTASVECALCGDAFVSVVASSGEPVPHCSPCVEFSEARHSTPKKLQEDLRKDKQAMGRFLSDRAAFFANKAAPDGKSFHDQEVFFEICSTSSLEERFDFVSRQDFKDKHGAFPCGAKLTQTKVTDHRGREITGILMRSDQPPQLVVTTTKRWVRRSPLMKMEQHLYEQQGEHVWASEVDEAQKNMGQALGGKYSAKLKSVDIYGQVEVANALEALVRRKKAQRGLESKSGMDALLGACDGEDESSGVDAGSGDEGEEEEADCDDPVIDPEAAGASLALARASRSASGQAAQVDNCALSMPPVVAPVVATATLVKRKAASVCGSARSAMASASPPARTSPSAPSTVSGRALSAASIASLCEDDRAHRVKPPSHWLTTMTPALVFSGKPTIKMVGCAKACVARVAAEDATQAAWGHSGSTGVSPLGLGSFAGHAGLSEVMGGRCLATLCFRVNWGRK